MQAHQSSDFDARALKGNCHHRGFKTQIPEVVEHERIEGVLHGGASLLLSKLKSMNFMGKLHNKVRLFKVIRGFMEADHILALSLNVFCGGETLDDINILRHNPAFLALAGAETIPSPTAVGDFCRRFSDKDIDMLQNVLNDMRVEAWKASGINHGQAIIDADGVFVPTEAQCAEGVELSYKGKWGYHPLVVSLSNTNEPIYIVNRTGARPSHEGAASYLTRAAELCMGAGFSKVLLRGDTDFSQTTHLDGWQKAGYHFVFGMDARKNLKALAGAIPDNIWQQLLRDIPDVDIDDEREKKVRFREQLVEEKGYENIRLVAEDFSEVPYKPNACEHTYRLVIVRKTLEIRNSKKANGATLFPEYRYFFYISNLPPEESSRAIVEHANKRCHQENLHAQLKWLNSLRAPLKDLNSNWAYMVITSLAWTYKTWIGLTFQDPSNENVMAIRQRIISMEFKYFLNHLIRIPAQVVRVGKKLVVRFLQSTPWTGLILDHLSSVKR